MKIHLLASISLASAILLTACGGGAGGGGDKEITPVQKNFEASATGTGYSTFLWNVPSTNEAPTLGTHYFGNAIYTLAKSPTSGPADLNLVQTNMTKTLDMPDLASRSVSRVLKDGKIFHRNASSPVTIAYVNGIVQYRNHDTSKSVVMWSMDIDEWSEPITLAGQINASTILKSYYSFSTQNTPMNFDPSKKWLAGASYIVRKRKYANDVIFVHDWTGNTYGDQPSPWGGTGKTIEEYFNIPSLVASGGVTYDGLVYSYDAGSIVHTEGARIWISKSKRPTSAAATESYFSLIELGGKIYSSTVIRTGTRERSIDAVDRTIVHDDSVRFNAAAVNSIRQTIQF